MKIKAELSISSIDKAIAEIRGYRAKLQQRVKLLVGQLVQDGINVARVRLAATQGDHQNTYVDYTVDSTNGDIIKASIFLQGSDALFIEFGAGIAYNTGAQHPKADEFGYGVGTYPSKHSPNKAINPGYWYYRDEAKELHRSIGTEATMPIFNAGENIRNQLITKAVETFMRG